MKRKSMVCILFVCLIILSIQLSYAGDVEDHAPIGVMAEHMHKQEEWMTSYRYMRMDMPENFSGTKSQTVSQVHNDFVVSPVDMTMEMHMVGAMYGVTDDITTMIMLPYIVKDMEHRRRTDSAQFSTHSAGIGDIRLSGLFSLAELVDQPVHANFGISIPTGSINRKDQTLLGFDRNLPYPMQLGSGTFAVLPGFTYFDKNEDWSWGFQQASTIQIGKNDQKYQLGDRHEMTSWVAYKIADWISTSFRIKGSIWGNINGVDQRFSPTLVSTADPNNQGGERIDLFLGVNLLGLEGTLDGHRLAIELGYPIYQSLDGPQLGNGLQGTVGWQKAF